MSTTEVNCRDCRVPMQIGFLMDVRGDRSCWIEGTQHAVKVFGMDTGMVKTAGQANLHVVTYRCPQCGGLRSFAPAADTL